MYKDIIININGAISLLLLMLLIYDNVCPVYVGFFFIFSTVFMYVILYEYETINKNNMIDRDLKIMVTLNVSFMI